MNTRHVVTSCVLATALAGCDSLQVNLPVQFQTLEQDQAALRVSLENRSRYPIKIMQPVQTDFLWTGQNVAFTVPQAGNYRLLVTAYEQSRKGRSDYRLVSTLEMPFFINGQDVIAVGGNVVGHHLVVTDSMISPQPPAR